MGGRRHRGARVADADDRILARNCVKQLVRVFDLLGSPITVVASLWMKLIRRVGVQKQPINRWILLTVGVFPIRNHYYEPLIRPDTLRRSLADERQLPGVNMNDAGQLELLSTLKWADELVQFPMYGDEGTFFYDNEMFGSGDAEMLYSLIRRFRPARIIEIGSGHSTLIAHAAVEENAKEDAAYSCVHTCIEPYQMPWLESTGVDVIRERVEDVGVGFFENLERNDVLFIDSSHMIRPQGDVLFEYLELLPTLKPGVIVHIHDIFTPRDYPREWVVEEMRMWNEQYLLEAFLTNNADFEVLVAMNYLKHRHPEVLSAACPVLARDINDREPGSMWLRRR